MPYIYSQATVTVSASRAGGVREEFLHDRRPPNIESLFPTLNFSYRCQNGETTLISLAPENKEESIEPLSNRGWALQERLLSSRVIE
jgi:hypothetical protein